MSLRIRSSPAIHSRKQTSHEPDSRFKVSDKVDSESRPPAGGATRILKVAFVIIVLLAGSLALWSAMRGPDPHYVTAKRLVTDYEYGKPKQLMNYEHPVYDEALGELALVDRNSPSAPAAEALKVEIERNIEEFRLHQARIADRLGQTRSKKQEREEQEFQTRAYSKLIPFDHEDHPECE